MKRIDLLAFIYLLIVLIPLGLFVWDLSQVIAIPRDVASLEVNRPAVGAAAVEPVAAGEPQVPKETPEATPASPKEPEASPGAPVKPEAKPAPSGTSSAQAKSSGDKETSPRLGAPTTPRPTR